MIGVSRCRHYLGNLFTYLSFKYPRPGSLFQSSQDPPWVALLKRGPVASQIFCRFLFLSSLTKWPKTNFTLSGISNFRTVGVPCSNALSCCSRTNVQRSASEVCHRFGRLRNYPCVMILFLYRQEGLLCLANPWMPWLRNVQESAWARNILRFSKFIRISCLISKTRKSLFILTLVQVFEHYYAV